MSLLSMTDSFGVSLALTVLTLSALYLLGYVVYQIYFHPLSQYPGPKFAAVTRLPTIVSLLRGRSVRRTHELHLKYGDIVRVGPDELSYINAQAWKDIYGHRVGGKESFPKDPILLGPELVGENGIIRAQGDENHARIRKNFSNGFSDRALKAQGPILQHYVDLLVQQIRQTLQSDPNAKINLLDMHNFATFDIMGDLAFGESLDLLKHSAYTPWVEAIYGAIKQVVLIQVVRSYPLLDRLFQRLLPKAAQAKRKAHGQFTIDRVNRRLARETNRPDIWTYVLKDGDEKGLTLPEMHATASTLMLAGTETTATLLSGLTFYLLKHRPILQKLVDEVRGSFQNASDIDMAALARLPYLNACLEEALRMYPPVAGGMHRVTPAGGAVICGKEVPEKTIVHVHNYSAYHSPTNFTLPDDFIPERWLGDPRFGSDNRAVLQPFSFGPRNCLGKNLAYHEMRLILSNLLYNFDLISLCEESQAWNDQKCYFLWEKLPLMVRLKPVART